MSTNTTTRLEGNASFERLPAITEHVELDTFGEPTGFVYVRCEGCGRERLGGNTESWLEAAAVYHNSRQS